MRAHRVVPSVIAVLATLLVAGCAARSPKPASFTLDLNKVVDLSYPFGPDTIYWPTAESFTMERVSYGMTPSGYWYAANNICMAEHGGTHMDAPIHFAQGKRSADAVPLSSCIGPGFENLAKVGRVPATGATLIALPMKITGGSGGPAGIIAILP